MLTWYRVVLPTFPFLLSHFDRTYLASGHRPQIEVLSSLLKVLEVYYIKTLIKYISAIIITFQEEINFLAAMNKLNYKWVLGRPVGQLVGWLG